MLAIGVYEPKNGVNIGTLWRSAHALGANLIFMIGGVKRAHDAGDTIKAFRHIPLIRYPDWSGFQYSRPKGARVIACELARDSESLHGFNHPDNAIYLLGAEDNGIPPHILNECDDIVQIPGGNLNVAVAGSILLYDRKLKSSLVMWSDDPSYAA